MTAGKDVDRSLVEAGSTVEMAEALRASGAVDELLAQIDTGEVALTGEGGLLPGLIKLGACQDNCVSSCGRFGLVGSL